MIHVQEEKDFINIGMNSLDVRPQARDQLNEVPTNEARNELSRRKAPS